MKKRSLVLAVALTAALAQAGYAATDQTETEVINHVGMGDISIELEEYERNAAGEEIPYENHKIVLPGQRIDKIVRIANRANPAWIRARLEYVSEDGMEGLSDEMVSLASDRWIPAGGYYYYNLPVEKNGEIDFIHQVRIPSEWDSSMEGKSFSIIVTAEAVQTDHFVPEFESDDPWFGTVIETCVHTPCDPAMAGQEKFSIAFEGGAEGLVRVGEDFFSNWGELMPGDHVSDSVVIKNNYRQAVTVYFRTETIADDQLLEALQLEIRSGENILYSGALKGVIENKVALAYLKRGEETVLDYELCVPAELNNQYAFNKTKTKWIFSAKLNSTSGGGGGGGGGSSSGGGTVVSDPSSPMEQDSAEPEPVWEESGIASPSNLAETGDSSNMGLYMFLMAESAIGFVIWFHKRKTAQGREEGDADDER